MTASALATTHALNPGQSSRVRLGDVLRLRKDVVHPHDKPFGPAVFVGLEHIESGTGRRVGAVEVEMSQLTGRKPRFYKGDIVYGYLRPYLNKVWLADFDGLCSVDQYVYEVDTENADPEYIAWFMRSPVYLERAPISTSPGQLPRIRTEEVAAVEVALPSPDDQRKIVRKVTTLMGAANHALRAIQEQVRAAASLNDALTRTDFDCSGSTRWPIQVLGDLATIMGGVQKTPDRSPTKFHRPYLTVRNVQRGHLDLSQVEQFEVTQAELSRLMLRTGDILIVEGNGSLEHIGRNALFIDDGREWVHQNHVIRVRLDAERCRPTFVSQYLNSGQGRLQMIEKSRTSSGLYTLSAGKVATLAIPVPPLEVQDRLLKSLELSMAAANALAKHLQAELSVVDVLPAAILRRAFIGGR